MKHALKIYGTLGPACADKDILVEMFRAGMTGIRLNLSHCSLPEREDWLSRLYQACDSLHIIPDFLVDLQGPELRVGKLSDNLILKEASEVRLIPLSKLPLSEDSDRLPAIPCPDILFSYLEEGQVIKMDDGKLKLNIIRGRDSSDIRARVQIGGPLLSGKSIAIEGVSIPLPSLTGQDLDTIRLLRQYRVTGVMQPFVRSREDLMALRRELLKAGMDYVKVYAKIETEEGIDHVMDFLPGCDEIIIARGDLGSAIPLPRLPIVQKELASICRMTKKPFMVVTQMLASMEEKPVPTRAELSDIANAVLDGASSIMLTGETAAGKYPVEAMKIFCQTAYEAQRYLSTGTRII